MFQAIAVLSFGLFLSGTYNASSHHHFFPKGPKDSHFITGQLASFDSGNPAEFCALCIHGRAGSQTSPPGDGHFSLKIPAVSSEISGSTLSIYIPLFRYLSIPGRSPPLLS
ncbi:hypothetical protein [Leptospira inadai]|uniref:hypothetical protein n=1 Tax=Leptospira inadai TaxID=29506 RepID=UPI000288E59E|nr:hypothetical protein [Leptospira inadai]